MQTFSIEGFLKIKSNNCSFLWMNSIWLHSMAECTEHRLCKQSALVADSYRTRSCSIKTHDLRQQSFNNSCHVSDVIPALESIITELSESAIAFSRCLDVLIFVQFVCPVQPQHFCQSLQTQCMDPCPLLRRRFGTERKCGQSVQCLVKSG